MKIRAKALWIGLAAGLLILGNGVCTYADIAVSNIRVTFRDRFDTADGTMQEPSIIVGGIGYRTDGINWSQGTEIWEPGKEVTAAVTLRSNTGYSFAAGSTVTQEDISGARLDSVKQEEDGSITIKAAYAPAVQLGRTKSAGWSGTSNTRAVWEPVPYATAYQLRLYRGQGEYITTLTLSGTSVDLSSYISNDMSYYYEVRATSRNSADAAFRRNGEYVASADTMVKSMGKTGGHWYWRHDGYCYMDENGIEAADGWRYIQGIWYYFDKDGRALTGWQQINGKWYYMDSQCRMQTGWLELDGQWYYMDSTGAMAVGWYQLSPAEWYYFYEDGRMAADATIDGYRLGADGKRM